MAQDIDFAVARLETLAREVPPVHAGHRAWAVMSPDMDDGRSGRGGRLRIRVRVVEVPIRDLDLRGGDFDGDEEFRVDRVVEDVGRAWEVLKSAGIECDGFGSPFRCGLPF